MFFGKFELNDNFINIFNNFVRTNLNDTTIDCFNKIIFVKKLKNGKYDARYSLESFIKANNDIIDDKTKGYYDITVYVSQTIDGEKKYPIIGYKHKSKDVMTFDEL